MVYVKSEQGGNQLMHISEQIIYSDTIRQFWDQEQGPKGFALNTPILTSTCVSLSFSL